MNRKIAVGLVAAAVAAVAIGAAAVGRATTDAEPSEPGPEPAQAPATHDPDYWTEERIREATPAPMPEVPGS